MAIAVLSHFTANTVLVRVQTMNIGAGYSDGFLIVGNILAVNIPADREADIRVRRVTSRRRWWCLSQRRRIAKAVKPLSLC
jgi:hypothetical protein